MVAPGTASQWTAQGALDLCSPEERQQIIQSFFEDESPSALALRELVAERLASLLHYRPQTFKKLPAAKQADHYLRFRTSPALEPCTEGALIRFHVAHRRPLMAAFLDRWGIPHEDGRLKSESARPPSLEEAVEAARAFAGRFERRQVAAYFVTAGLQMPAWRAPLWGALDLLMAEGWLVPRDEVEAPPAPAPEEPETAESFTTLDNLLVKTIVGAVSEVAGAPNVEAVTDIVEEVIRLNADRQHSYFHWGFLQGLLGRQGGGDFLEMNAARRAWMFAGRIMAAARKQGPGELLSLVKESPKDFTELMRTPEAQPAAARVLSPLFEAYFADDRDAEVVGLVPKDVLEHAVRRELDRERHALLRLVLDRAGALLRLGRATEAQRLLDLLDAAVTSMRARLPVRIAYELDRRRAQALRGVERFTEAERAFERICHDSPAADRAQLVSDLVLCHGKFRSLWDVRLPTDRADASALLARLDVKLLAEALDSEGTRVNAEYLAGVRALLGKEHEEASRRLEPSFAGMGQQLDLYGVGGLYARVGVYLALALLNSMDEARFAWALQLLERFGDEVPRSEFPRWLLREPLRVAVELMTPVQARTLFDWSQRRFEGEVDGLLDEIRPVPEMLAKVPALEQALVRRSRRQARPASKRFADLLALLTSYQQQRKVDDTASVLDQMEELSIEHSELQPLLVKLLDDPLNYEGAWSREEADVCRSRLHESSGDCRSAAHLLAATIHRLLTQGDTEGALGYHERLKALALPAEETAELDARIKLLCPAELPPTPPPAERLRLLFVGGNEKQEKYDLHVKEILGRTHPNVEIDFLHTGWTSNWGVQLAEFKRLMADRDGAVVMTYIRTELGRQARKHLGEIDKPWHSCTGHGRDSMVRATLGAIGLTARHRRQKSEGG